ncbi:SpoIIE family protein phosphatase [Streptomyces erythrochromogenes]|uniref:SpoIIE family protein phosphatase n=1 Tax=Streptomyces erythrochromogenes TaxID=285574 RepID=UPI0023EE3E85
MGELAAKAQEAQGEELFATAVLIEYDSLAHRVAVTDHGHVEPVLISRGEVRVLSGLPALPLGLGGLAETGTAAVWRHRFARGRHPAAGHWRAGGAPRHRRRLLPAGEPPAPPVRGPPRPGPADVINFLDTALPRHTRLHDDVAMMGGGGHRNGGRRIPGGEQWSRSHSTVRSA